MARFVDIEPAGRAVTWRLASPLRLWACSEVAGQPLTDHFAPPV